MQVKIHFVYHEGANHAPTCAQEHTQTCSQAHLHTLWASSEKQESEGVEIMLELVPFFSGSQPQAIVD